MATPNSTLSDPYLTAAINDQQIIKYLSVIGPTILAYDWFLTIDSELTHVWSRRWGMVEIIYFLARYSPFIDTPIMLIYHFFLVNPSDETCHVALTVQVLLYGFGGAMNELIIIIRTWAVWERNKIVGIILFTEAAMVAVFEMYASGAYANSLTFLQGYNLGGCFVLSSSQIILVGCYILLLNQFTYLVLIVLKTYPRARSERKISLLSSIILQDGVLFYIMLISVVVIGMVFLFQPGIMSTVLTVPSRICQSIFATRIILHIRDVDKWRTEDAFTSTAVRSLMFADIVGHIQDEMEDQPIKVVNAQDQA